MLIVLNKSFPFTTDGGRTKIQGESGSSYEVPDDFGNRLIADGRASVATVAAAPSVSYETKDIRPDETEEAPEVKPKRRRRRKKAE